ncbi:MAG: NAD(P)/FAD-dependent oxidoreductase [Rhodospirillaceae bacterium]|nr:NAD(P)/FAD-dependent oxidoreductase [Rhodospirillaceae bacterium]
MLPSRRSMVKGLGAAALTGSAAIRSRSARAQDKADVVVLGAGLSGLQSALLLEELGYSVLVLEGRDRIGGKVLTHKMPNGFVELGGQTIAAGYGRMRDLAARTRVELFDYLPRVMMDGAPVLALDQKVIAKTDWAGSPQNPFAPHNRDKMPWELASGVLAKHNPLADPGDWSDPKSFNLDVPFYDFLKAQGLSDAEIKLSYNTNVGYGTSAHDVSALMMFFIQSWNKQQSEGAPNMFGAPGGNTDIINGMAKELSTEVRLNQEVQSIDLSDAGVEVGCANGSRYSAKIAICSFPFSTLKYVDISPTLSGAQQQAVYTLPFMKITITVLETKEPFWVNDGLGPMTWTNGPAGIITGTRYGESDDVNALVSWTRGHDAARLDRLGPEHAKALVIQELEAARPAAKGKVKAVHYHSWGMEPFSAGDWAVFRPGQISAFRSEMANPHGRLFFCGEHTAVSNRGMEGALESAERVVFEALDRI